MICVRGEDTNERYLHGLNLYGTLHHLCDLNYSYTADPTFGDL